MFQWVCTGNMFFLWIGNSNKIHVFCVQYSPFITLCLGSIRMGCVISDLCYKGTILQKNCRKMTRKMTILWSFSYQSFVKFHSKKNWEPQHDCGISKSMLK